MMPQDTYEDPITEHFKMKSTKLLSEQPYEEDPEPLTILFLEEVQQEWERQLHLDSLVEEAIRNEDSLFNPILL